MKTIILDAFTANPGDLNWDAIDQITELVQYPRTAPNELLERIQGAEALLTNKVIISSETMDQVPSLKYIGVLATGTNVVDLEAATARGITVTNIPAYSTPFVAQHSFALILNIFNKVAQHSESAKAGAWADCQDFSYTHGVLNELQGKTLGIIGLGSIGKKVAEIAKAFGMKIVALKSARPAKDPIERLEFNDFFSQSDIISLHCPLSPESQEIINAKSLALMKKSAVIINTGRGPLINEADLAQALNEGQIAAAGLDVLSSEPPAADNPLLSAKNCFITPHIAWAAQECRERLIQIAADNIKAFLSGEVLNKVN
ncbi:glycerate dehydrogenase [Lentisphaera araneosa HTCC2155]|uniref:Glycerate dehydrogenase n=1 Tax=Lentisphaera araneosa HTCC2155 TaxID=313628 RepID=A6DP40_9BACT|nr:D-2-hydroxyacid dehydrogenase [Lentisphaera araneosa]EDM26572.1 glycerate dehydrogenase [Lentisphaera araneosa HTCC2155]